MLPIYTPWKPQKTSSFLNFSRGYNKGTLALNGSKKVCIENPNVKYRRSPYKEMTWFSVPSIMPFLKAWYISKGRKKRDSRSGKIQGLNLLRKYYLAFQNFPRKKLHSDITCHCKGKLYIIAYSKHFRICGSLYLKRKTITSNHGAS